MFALYPDGKKGGANFGASSPFYQGLWFFGKITLYFIGIRTAYVYFGDKPEQRAIGN